MAKKKEEKKAKEKRWLTIDVDKAFVTVWILLTCVMDLWPELIQEIADVAKSGEILDIIWHAGGITLFVMIAAGVIDLGKLLFQKISFKD